MRILIFGFYFVFFLFSAGLCSAENLNSLPTDLRADLIVAEPGNGVYSAFGHCALRLRCQSKGLDYCFSYGMPDNPENLIGVFAGTAKAGYYAAESNPYLMQYAEVGRGVKQYQLNLSVEQVRRLWEKLDAEVARGFDRKYDYTRHSCSAMVSRIVSMSLVNEYIRCDEKYEQNLMSARMALDYQAGECPWTKLFWMFMMGTNADKPSDADSHMMPELLVKSWKSGSFVNDRDESRPVFSDSGQWIVLPKKSLHLSIAPSIFFLFVLLIAVLLLVAEQECRWRKFQVWFDGSLLAIQTILGIGVVYLAWFSRQETAHFNWYILIFNPLPFIAWSIFLWKKTVYRKVWLIFASVSVLFIVLTPFVPQIYSVVDIIAALFAIRCWAAYQRKK